MEKKSGISQRSVLRILHQHKFHPYRMSLHQDLYGNDFLKRVNFCKWIRRKMRTDVSFLSHVLFSGEVNFANTWNVNRHKMHYWANKNPRWMRTVPFQHPWSVNCWCGIVGDHVIGPYIFFWRSPDWASLRKLSAKRTASINERRALAFSHEHVDATRRCTTRLCSVFKTNDEWDFWRKVYRTRRPRSLDRSFARSNITRLLFMGFCWRTRSGGSTYHVMMLLEWKRNVGKHF